MNALLRSACARCLRLATAVLLAAGCATPIGVKRADEHAVYRQLTLNALISDRMSAASAEVLERSDLVARFEEDPVGALAALHAGLGGADEPDRLFALAELSYLHAREADSRPYYLAAAAYAYAYAFPSSAADAPDAYDPRLRAALDVYNLSIAEGLIGPTAGEIELAARGAALPFGRLEIRADPQAVQPYGQRLEQVSPLYRWEVRGLRNRYRQAGIGAPVIARLGDAQHERWLPPRAKLPFTLVLRFQGLPEGLKEGNLSASLELHDPDVAHALSIRRQSVPLEADSTTPIAYRLEGSPLWDSEIAGFRRGDFLVFEDEPDAQLRFLSPYRPGRIPVVFVHGTASSPARWAEMANEILGDPVLASHYQLWFFFYNTGNPIALSALNLRETLQAVVADVDPHGKDPALRRMVVIGHSQGGLLTKLTVVDSGTRFWEAITATPFEEAELDPDTRDLLGRALFVEPLPFVQRVVFIATPHRGSFLAESWLGAIARRLVSLPATVTKVSLQLMTLQPGKAYRSATRSPTSIDNMNGSNPFLQTLASLPVVPGVKAHSIIAVAGDGPVEAGNDGVVRYTSAHLDGVESELVVHSGHSTQAEPATIQEVRRILYLQLADQE